MTARKRPTVADVGAMKGNRGKRLALMLPFLRDKKGSLHTLPAAA
jgi:hypothetical protein